MQSDDKTLYSGKDNLKFMHKMHNYNSYIKQILVSFIKNYDALDFGAADGKYPLLLKGHHINVDCVEIDPIFIKNLKDNHFTVFEALSNIDKKYKRIYSLDVIEHIEDDDKILHDLYNALEKNGEILIYVPAFNCLYSALDKSVGHYRQYTKSMLIPLMEKAGFKITTARYVDCIGFFASLYFKYFGSKSGSISDKGESIYFYYQYIFPISIKLDRIFGYFLEKIY